MQETTQSITPHSQLIWFECPACHHEQLHARPMTWRFGITLDMALHPLARKMRSTRFVSTKPF
jgi:hypothetical protein